MHLGPIQMLCNQEGWIGVVGKMIKYIRCNKSSVDSVINVWLQTVWSGSKHPAKIYYVKFEWSTFAKFWPFFNCEFKFHRIKKQKQKLLGLSQWW